MCLETTSSVFKKGDRVKISESAAFHDRIIQDTGSEIVTVLMGPEGSVFGGNYYFEETYYIVFGDHLTLVEEEKEVKTFKVGDRVRVLRNTYYDGTIDSSLDQGLVGKVGRIKYVSSVAINFPYGVEFEFGETEDFSADDLELESSVKVGDEIEFTILDGEVTLGGKVTKVVIEPVVTYVDNNGEEFTDALSVLSAAEDFEVVANEQESDEVETVVINGLVYDLAEVSERLQSIEPLDRVEE